MEAARPLTNVARANRLLDGLWRRRLLPRPELETLELERAALRGADHAAFGADEWWRTPFSLLVDGLAREAGLNPLGMAMAHGQIVMALRSRIRARSLWRERPEILSRPIASPIIILGQMRSGTTRLQRLLACDPRFGHTRLHESLIPMPFSRIPARADRRGLQARAGLAMLRRFNPQVGRIHPTSAGAPEEEFGLFSFSFGSAQYEAQWRVPSFAQWWEAADRTPLYREFSDLLRTAAWHRSDPVGMPVILKAPQFLQDLPALISTFPDARLIVIDRDPAQIVASSSSLVWNQMRIQSDQADPIWVGREWLRKTRLRQKIAAGALAAGPQVIRLGFEEMNRDWRAAVARIYRYLELDLDAPLLETMSRYVESARSHLGHHYRLEDFGLSRTDVEAELGAARLTDDDAAAPR